jgi:membrane-bound lytic murein transglycosylase D
MWFEINFILILSYLAFWLFKQGLKNESRFKFEKIMGYTLLVMLVFPILLNVIPVEESLPPVMKSMISDTIKPAWETTKAKHLIFPLFKEPTFERVKTSSLYYLLIFISLFLWLFEFVKDMSSIRKLISQSTLIKKHGRVQCYLCPGLRVPCSFWFPHKYFVLIPEEVLIRRKMFTHSLSHELQHHRQGDTKIIYLVELMKAFFYLNPFTHLWIKIFHENRELECDREVVKRKGFDPIEYGNTLIDVAKLNSGIDLNKVWAMASLTKIKRRIEMIALKKKSSFEKSKCFIFVTLLMGFTWQTVAASRNILGVKRMNIQEAKEWVQDIKFDIPIEVNETVLKYLNYYLSDPKGKAYLQRSKERMQKYKAFIQKMIKDSSMPEALLAVPLMESGYNNSAVSSVGATGLWQFIPSTARKYGLVVNSQVDERRHVKKATQAALSYYQDLLKVREFNGDWRLALLAYNTGENRLASAIRSQGTSNPWSYNDLGDHNYLAKIMAGVILLQNPN